ncbi:MAG: ABC transporter permease [Phycisphaerae bacterium]|nr:ABC transporter permease [Phycisphaerae bacterium]
MQLWVLIVDTFREARDRRIFWLMLLISVLTAALMASVTFYPDRVSLLFGLWDIRTTAFFTDQGLEPDRVGAVVVDGIMDNILGAYGVILLIIASAGFFPALLERGGVEVLVSKPLPRWQVYLGKYLGALFFVFVQAGVFVGLTFLVAGLQWKVWLPGYLLCIPLVVVLFSYLYCVTALVGVLTRSTVLAIVLTIISWIGFSGVQSLGDTFVMYPEWQQHRSMYRAVQIASWVVPKTSDFTYLARRWAGSANPVEVMPMPTGEGQTEIVQRAQAAEKAHMKRSAWLSVGSSLAFEAVIVALGMAYFCRRDL